MIVKPTSPQDLTKRTGDPVAFLIVVFKKKFIHHEGDERSRTNPGHGYSAYDEEIQSTELIAVSTMADLMTELKALYDEDRTRKDILIVKVDRLVSTEVTLNINLK